MGLTTLLVKAARIVGAALVDALSSFKAGGMRLVEQRLFDVPIALFGTNREFEVFARYRVPVLHMDKAVSRG